MRPPFSFSSGFGWHPGHDVAEVKRQARLVRLGAGAVPTWRLAFGGGIAWIRGSMGQIWVVREQDIQKADTEADRDMIPERAPVFCRRRKTSFWASDEPRAVYVYWNSHS